MKLRNLIPKDVTNKYRIKLVWGIALAWTIIDTLFYLYKFYNDRVNRDPTPFDIYSSGTLLLRVGIILVICLFMAYLLVYYLKGMARQLPLWLSLFIKAHILVAAVFLLNFLLHYTYLWLIEREPAPNNLNDLDQISYYIIQNSLFVAQLIRWLVIFLFTILFIEVYDKYSPGVFFDILFGKYIQPKNEHRIIMFIDLVDSTPIAEQLGHTTYFRFIRDFIYYISIALLQNNGQIYQYVGDEVVVSWKYRPHRTNRNCLQALLDCRKIIEKNAPYFRKRYNVVPEFKAGIHAGEITIGEIGAVKKDLVMSGDVMNTTARIRSACSDLHHKYIVSKDFVTICDLKDWQITSLGMVDLKGKEIAMELFALNI
jgi:adenylate cyclase